MIVFTSHISILIYQLCFLFILQVNGKAAIDVLVARLGKSGGRICIVCDICERV